MVTTQYMILHVHVGIVWSGSGSVNGLKIDCNNEQHREFLVTPNSAMELKNDSEFTDLIVFTVFPMKPVKTD